MPRLTVYRSEGLPAFINNVDVNSVLAYIEQLDGDGIKVLAINTAQGCMSIGARGDKMIIAFEDHDCVVIRPHEIVSRQVGTEIALFFLENAGMPAGKSRTVVPQPAQYQFATVS